MLLFVRKGGNFYCTRGSECSVICGSDECSDFNFYCDKGATCSMTCDEDCTDCPKLSTFSALSSLDTKNLELFGSNMDLLTLNGIGNNTYTNIFNNTFIIWTILAFSLFGFYESCKSIYYYYCCNYNNKNINNKSDKHDYTYHSI